MQNTTSPASASLHFRIYGNQPVPVPSETRGAIDIKTTSERCGWTIGRLIDLHDVFFAADASYSISTDGNHVRTAADAGDAQAAERIRLTCELNDLANIIHRNRPDIHRRFKITLGSDIDYIAPLGELQALRRWFYELDKETQRQCLGGWPAAPDRPSVAELTGRAARMTPIRYLHLNPNRGDPIGVVEWKLDEGSDIAMHVPEGRTKLETINALLALLQFVESNFDAMVAGTGIPTAPPQASDRAETLEHITLRRDLNAVLNDDNVCQMLIQVRDSLPASVPANVIARAVLKAWNRNSAEDKLELIERAMGIDPMKLAPTTEF